MKRLLLMIVVMIIGIGLSRYAWAIHGGTRETNVVTNDSDTLGLDPTAKVNPVDPNSSDIIAIFTQDGSRTIGQAPDPITGIGGADYSPVGNPGAFTNNPFGCVATFADFGFGNDCGGANDPMTAPNFDGPNTARGTIVVKSPANLDTTDASGRLTLTGTIDFCLNIDQKCDPNNANDTTGMATVTQTMTQRLEGLDVNDPQGRTAFQEISVDNTRNGSPVTFMTQAVGEELGPAPARDIPWSIDLTQDIPFPGDNFQLIVSGIFPYEAQAGDINRTSAYRFDGGDCDTGGAFPGSGFVGSCYPRQFAFDLPGFGGGKDNFPDP